MTVSSTFKAAFFAASTDEVPLVIVEIDHDDFDAPIRCVNNFTDITSGGDVYTAFPFTFRFPPHSSDELPLASITISAIDQTIIQEIRAISTRPTVTVSLILASDPDTIEAGPYEFKLTNVEYDIFQITGGLGYDDFFDEPYPGDKYTPANHPGLWS